MACSQTQATNQMPLVRTPAPRDHRFLRGLSVTAYYGPDGGESRCPRASESGAESLFPLSNVLYTVLHALMERAHLCGRPALAESVTHRHPVSHGEVLSAGSDLLWELSVSVPGRRRGQRAGKESFQSH